MNQPNMFSAICSYTFPLLFFLLLANQASSASLKLKTCPDSPNCVSSQAQDPAHHIKPFTYTSTKIKAKKRFLPSFTQLCEPGLWWMRKTLFMRRSHLPFLDSSMTYSLFGVKKIKPSKSTQVLARVIGTWGKTVDDWKKYANGLRQKAEEIKRGN